MSESMADFEKEIDESLKTLNVVENEGEATEEETGFNAWDKKYSSILEDGTVLTLKVGGIVNKGVIALVEGVRGFIPASRLSLSHVDDLNPWLGRELKVRIITADAENDKLVLSATRDFKEQRDAEKN